MAEEYGSTARQIEEALRRERAIPLPQPDDSVLYLDENLCNSRAILDMLTKLGVHFEHLAHFERGIVEETWLPLVGSKGWGLPSADKRIRYNFLEKHTLEQHAVREFVFTSGNMSGQDMATALELARA